MNKVQEILRDGLVYQLCISLIIIVQSVLLFLFYSKILISKSSYEIKTLIILGYSVNTISKTLSSLTTKFYVCMVGLSFIIALISKNYINYWLINQKQIELCPRGIQDHLLVFQNRILYLAFFLDLRNPLIFLT